MKTGLEICISRPNLPNFLTIIFVSAINIPEHIESILHECLQTIRLTRIHPRTRLPMKKTDLGPEELIAPCGTNCAICSRFLAYANNLKRSQCTGCRPGNPKCSYLFEKCSGINSALQGNSTARFCFECDTITKLLEKRNIQQ